MTAPQPPRDGEVCACGHRRAAHFIRNEQALCRCGCRVFRPAAPSEPPAADSPTPVEVWRDDDHEPYANASHWQPAAPSPVDATEPPAETQQDSPK